MIEAVLDASAALAYLRGEPGGEAVEAKLARSVMSSVNLAEVVAKLIERGASPTLAEEIVGGLGCEIAAVDAALGLRAGVMHGETGRHGLSVGDRVCLALAEREGLPALTADRVWGALDLPIQVALIR